MASHANTVRIQEYVVSVDNLYNDGSEANFRPKEGEYDSRLLPNEVFVELEELRIATAKGDLEWEETARWIQYEEDVVEETGKWGSPHIAALEYKHIVMVKKLLQQGVLTLLVVCVLLF